MPKMNQIIAIDKGIKERNRSALTELHKLSAKKELFTGQSRSYSPKDDDPTKPMGEILPPEGKKVSEKAEVNLTKVAALQSEVFDITATRDFGNCEAKADIVINDKVLLANVPATYLLFLEKQLNDIHTFVKCLPVLDSSETWAYDSGQDLFAAPPTKTSRTKKLTRPLVLYDATDKHPAQVKEIVEDVIAGEWTTIKYSAALPAKRANEILARVEALQIAVKFAREKANEKEVEKKTMGEPIFSYLFG